VRGFGEIEGDNESRHYARVRRKRPRFRSGTQQHIGLSLVALEGVALDHVGQLTLWHVRLNGPGSVGQLPAEQMCGARAAEHEPQVGEQLDQLLRANQKAAARGALAKARQQPEQAALLEARACARTVRIGEQAGDVF
jgi:hypothetical protein